MSTQASPEELCRFAAAECKIIYLHFHHTEKNKKSELILKVLFPNRHSSLERINV